MKDIFLIDFDMTITFQDTTNALLTTHSNEWKEIHRKKFLEKKMTILQYVQTGLEQLNISKEQYVKTLQESIEVDDTFKYFVEAGLLFKIVSAGTKLNVIAPLEKYHIFLEQEHVISNDIDFTENGIKITHPYLDEARENGVDKVKIIKEYQKKGYRVIFVGDGPSDYKAAHNADIVFVRKGTRLIDYCISQKIAFFEFQDFDELQAIYQKELKN